MNRLSRSGRRALISILMLTLCLSLDAQAQKKRTSAQRLSDLEETVKNMRQNQLDLEARIAVLERLNLTPSPDLLRVSYFRASRDAMINSLNNLAADAYQYRIRPTTMGGGGGTFTGYRIPKRLASTENDTIAATVFPDSIIFKGTWKKGQGTVQCTVPDTGRPGRWMYSGEFE